MELVERLKERGVGLRVLTGARVAIDTIRPKGKFTFALFAALAEFKCELIRERTKAGMQAAKRCGRHVGRPPKITPERCAHAREQIAGGKDKAEVAALLGVDVATLQRALRSQGLIAGPLSFGHSPARIFSAQGFYFSVIRLSRRQKLHHSGSLS